MKKFKRLMACLVALAVCIGAVMPGLGISAEEPLPDLVVQDFWWAPWGDANPTGWPKVGQEVIFRAKVRNDGGALNSDEPLVINFYSGDKLIGRSTNPNDRVKDSPTYWVNVVLEGSDTAKWLAEEGHHELTAVVDPDNLIAESNEDNNVSNPKYLDCVDPYGEPTEWFVDATDPEIVYDAQQMWLWGDSWGDYNGTCIELGKPGDKFTYTFTGASSIRIFAQTHGHGGTGKVTIDGVDAGIMNCNGPDGGKKLVYGKSGLNKDESHTLVVECINPYLYIDCMILNEEDLNFGSNADLKSMKIAGEDLKGFSTETTEYTYQLSYGTVNMPEITGVPVFEGATIEVTNAKTINDTAIVKVTSQDGTTTKEYKVTFTIDNSLETVEGMDGWNQLNIGNYSKPGIPTYDAETGTLSIKAESGDIWGSQDSMYFVFQQVTGNKDFIARLKGPTKVHDWAKAGLFIRESLARGSKYAAVYVPGNKEINGIRIAQRPTSGGETSDFTVSSASYPGEYTWIRIMRQGDKFTSYLSADGETWDRITSYRIENVPETYFIGFGACGNAGPNNMTEAVFDNIVVRDAEIDQSFSDATLKELRVNGIRIPEFDPAVTEYNIELPIRQRPNTVPVVEYATTNEYATAVKEGDSALPGSVTVTVTAEDGSATQTYTINFTISEEPQKISYTTSWVGNTFNGVGGVQDGQWVQNFIRGMVVMPDGTCYTESEWDEAGRTHGIYKDGKCIGNKNMDIDATKTTDKNGNVWAIVDGKIVKEGTNVEITSVGKPAALAIANDGKLMIADNARRQVLFYDISTDTPTESWAFGYEGGMSSDTEGLVDGEYHHMRFYHLTGTGMDEKGNIYVSLSFRSVASFIRCITPEGELVWDLQSTSFVDSFDFDPTTDGKDIYGAHEHYVMDYTQEPGKEQKLVGFTLDLDKYPNDPRAYFGANFISSVWIEYVDGEKLMFATGMFPNGVYIWRFEEETAVPCGIIARGFQREDDGGTVPNQPNSPYIWRDLNGNGDFETNEFTALDYNDSGDFGWEVDQNGNIWRNYSNNKVAQYKCSGIDEHGSPIYNVEDIVVYELPDLINPVRRLQYDVDTDSLYVTGYDKNDLYEGHIWGSVGRAIYRYDNISTGEWTLHENYPMALPYYCYVSENFTDQAFNITTESFHVEKGRMFLTFMARGPLGYKTGETHVFDTETTEDLGCITPGDVVGGFANVGWIDIPHAIKALQTSDGNYKVLVEEDAKAKQLLYTVTPYDGTIGDGGDGGDIGGDDDGMTVKAQAVDTAVTVDGKLDESFWTVLGTAEKQTGSENNTNVVNFGAGWDETYLYVGVDVKDDKVLGTPNANHWDNDAIEVFIDGNNDKGGVYDNHDVQYLVSWGKDTLFSTGTGKDEGVLWAIEGTDYGYVVEMAVPWATLNVEPVLGKKIGFDIANDDRMREDGARAGSLTWAGDGNNFQSTENFGGLVLADDTVLASKTEESIVVNGEITEGSWNLDRVVKKQTGSEFDESKVTFGLLWDDTYLYVAAQTEDPIVLGTPENVHWENDAIEIFIDANNDKGGVYDSHDVQYIVSWAKEDLFSTGSGKDAGVLYKMIGTDKGYDLEMAIPWSTLDIVPEDGMEIGFDIAHDDRCHEDGGRAGSITWAGDGNNFQSTENFGVAVMKGATVVEPEATEPEATEPEATEPEATEPEATEPEATEPEETEPEATEPEATEPEATEPEATEPEATEPEVTEPEATEPEATEPQPTKPADPDSPSTGDSIFFWIPVFVVTLMAAAALVWVRRREA